jgi:hypothetical protein
MVTGASCAINVDAVRAAAAAAATALAPKRAIGVANARSMFLQLVFFLLVVFTHSCVLGGFAFVLCVGCGDFCNPPPRGAVRYT